MTKDEALKMAIKLLESLKTGKENFTQSNIYIVCDICKDALATNEESLLVQPTIKESLKVEQPAQEPVAWMDKSRYFLELDLEDLCVMARCKKHEAVPLYTHPSPAKEWQRLSRKKLEKIYGDSTKIDWGAYEAIDQALQKLNPFS